MRYLAFAYAIFFIGWSVFELRDLQRSRYPRWLLGIEVVSKLLMVTGMLLYFVQHGVAGQLHSVWETAIFPIVGLEVMLRVLAIRNDEQDLALSSVGNRRAGQFGLGMTAFVVGPAAYMGFRFAYQEASPSTFVLLVIAAAVGFGLAYRWPKLSGCFRSISERNMVEWLESSAEFSGTPDEIVLLDNSKQKWPGFEEEVCCQLFHIRYGQEWYVGLTGPATHCLAKPIGKDCSVSEVYERYKFWFADHVSRAICREAVRDFPDDFRKIVEDAMPEGEARQRETGYEKV